MRIRVRTACAAAPEPEIAAGAGFALVRPGHNLMPHVKPAQPEFCKSVTISAKKYLHSFHHHAPAAAGHPRL